MRCNLKISPREICFTLIHVVANAQKGSHVLKSKLLNIFLSEKNSKIWVFLENYVKDYFHFNNNLLTISFSVYVFNIR